MFERATRKKYRFPSPQGAVSVEDLWDLPLTSKTGRANLDDIARGLNRQIKAEGDDESFVVKDEAKDDTLETMLEIVKRVIAVKLAEADEAKKAGETRANKQRILAIIANKQNEQLEAKSIDELTKMVEAL